MCQPFSQEPHSHRRRRKKAGAEVRQFSTAGDSHRVNQVRRKDKPLWIHPESLKRHKGTHHDDDVGMFSRCFPGVPPSIWLPHGDGSCFLGKVHWSLGREDCPSSQTLGELKLFAGDRCCFSGRNQVAKDSYSCSYYVTFVQTVLPMSCLWVQKFITRYKTGNIHFYTIYRQLSFFGQASPQSPTCHCVLCGARLTVVWGLQTWHLYVE